MPTRWSGTIQERLARMDKAGRRCDANSRHCPRAAVEEYDLYPADGHGNRIEGAEMVTKKCCSYHRSQFLGNGMWSLTASRELDKKPSQRPGRYGIRPPAELHGSEATRNDGAA